MFNTLLVRRACTVIENNFRAVGLCLHTQPQPKLQTSLSRQLHQGEDRNLSSESEEPYLPKAPPLTTEDLDFMEEVVKGNSEGSVNDWETPSLSKEKRDVLPPAPKVTSDWEVDVAEEAEPDEVEDVEPVPYFPPLEKFFGLSVSSSVSNQNRLLSEPSEEVNLQSKPSGVDRSGFLDVDPSLAPVLAAWARAVVPSPIIGGMRLYELANRNTTVKELVKLGVDFSRISERHGDLEKLLHMSWEDEIKPFIRFLVDCGIEPDHLGMIFTRNTKLLMTDKDDIQVRLNYLEAKKFSPEQIKSIINKAPSWLTLSTKEVDSRLGFIQSTFKLGGNEVRLFASSYPTIVSSRKWEVFVDTTKILDREFGFSPQERKELLFKKPQCYMRPSLLRKSFDLCHIQIGLSHSQLVKHADVLLCRTKIMKPRLEFLKFLKRDIFNVSDPLYISPDWLWQGTVEEFCVNAARSSVEEYESFLKHSHVAI